jgi:BioD-like phosphotransacetylase family protein
MLPAPVTRYTADRMSNLLIVSAERGEGKTAVAAALASRVIASGGTAIAVKPFGGEEEIGPDSDAAVFAALLGGASETQQELAIPAKGLTKKSMQDAARAVRAAKADLAVVEGSSQLSAENSAALADALKAKVVVVVRHARGMTVADVTARTEPFSKNLGGVVLNCRGVYTGAEAEALAADLEAAGIPVIAVIPEDRRLLGVTVGKLAEHLNGRLIQGEDGADALVEHFLVGGWLLDDGALYFGTRSDKAVVIRGDRPDLAMSALSTPTKVLVLTKGIEPIEYVAYEAGEEGTALLVVEQDTLATMDAIGTVIESARFDHPDKMARMAELFETHGNAEALVALAS